MRCPAFSGYLYRSCFPALICNDFRDMKISLLYFSAVMLIVSSQCICAITPEDPFKITTSDYNADPLTGRRYLMTLKVSTLQVLFSEAPFSIEIFGRNGISHQLQAGIIFPLRKDSFLVNFFESSGKNATASPEGLISYRNSPYNTHGVSFKYELRQYGRRFYFAPQAMYKYNHYDDYSFRVLQEDRAVVQTESKRSVIFGIGFMTGRQTYFMRHVTDWYAGVGLRARKTTYDVHEVHNAHFSQPGYSGEKFFVYPVFNFGLRTGLVL
jgi:hypothetical protein